MTRRAKVWLAVALALAAVVAVMTSITATLLDTERAALEAVEQSAREDRVRLALWRLDSAIPGQLSQEMARVALLAEQPSPPAALPPNPEVRGRFVREADGALRWLTPPDSPVLDALSDALRGDDLGEAAQFAYRVDVPKTAEFDTNSPQAVYGNSQQKIRSSLEWSRRASSARDNLSSIEDVQLQNSLSLLNTIGNDNADNPNYGDIALALEQQQASLASAQLGPVTPVWIDEQLVLVRRVRRGESVVIHGAWMDWDAMRSRLQTEIADLLPSPTFEAVRTPVAEDAGRLLATLPVRLVPGPLPAPPRDAFSPVRASILLGWGVVLVGTGTVIGLLLWSMALSERRAAFVSAVTHELRTPLTTFRMYTEMLGEKMVEEKRDRYVATLRSEAERLGHLVENVLAYARIERRNVERDRERVQVGALIERVQGRLRDRCAAARTDLNVALANGVEQAFVEVDVPALEQVLFNLVDNAAKYAPSSTDGRGIVLEAVRCGRGVQLAVRDHGPGIPADERRRIFEPFVKARRDESGSKPGVGLGLALCRGVAVQMGGALTLEDADPGARFVLDLPGA
ncbi:MAG: ATP-binding protein [Myxococcota bacterium]